MTKEEEIFKRWFRDKSDFTEAMILNAIGDALMQGKNQDNEIEEVQGSSYCAYSVIENKLAILSKNQIKIFNEIKKISAEL